MDKIKRFIDINVPVTTCTLRCHYCYITQHKLFGGPLPEFKYSPEHVRKALSKERLGGICLLNFCGNGETLLAPQMTDYVRVLLEEGHYVMVVTNGTITKRFKEFCQFPKELMKRLFFKFSYHFLELKKRNLLEVFFTNVCSMRDAGASFTIEATPSDELIPYIQEMKDTVKKYVGAINHVTIARDERDPEKLPILTSMNESEYKKTWDTFESNFFDYKFSVFGVKRKEFCYAGAWSLVVNLQTGVAQQCYKSHFFQNIFEDVNKPIQWKAIGYHCLEHHCYNAHAWLVLGLIPELEAPTYGDIRNRVCADGSEWLQPEMKAFMSTKLFESNKPYSKFKLLYLNCKECKYNNIKQRLIILYYKVRNKIR